MARRHNFDARGSLRCNISPDGVTGDGRFFLAAREIPQKLSEAES